MSAMPSVLTKDLGRVYKIRNNRKEAAQELVALNGVNLEIHQGELFGVLGPNGAGKTTLIKILTTLLAPTRGEACVAGINVAENPAAVRERINMVSGGETSGYGLLTVRENLWMFAQFYGIPSKAAYERIDSLLAIVGMADRRNTKCSDLSTGLRQKMNIVRGFMTDPKVLFLDEPTLGLDVGAARDVRAFVREWVDSDPTRTLLLTTHYMVEAEEMCDRVAIINQGRVLACDTPKALKAGLRTDAIYTLQVDALEDEGFEALKALPGIRTASRKALEDNIELELVLEEDSVLTRLIQFLADHGSTIRTLHKREATLEDVFVSLVGVSMKDVENSNADQDYQE